MQRSFSFLHQDAWRCALGYPIWLTVLLIFLQPIVIDAYVLIDTQRHQSAAPAMDAQSVKEIEQNFQHYDTLTKDISTLWLEPGESLPLDIVMILQLEMIKAQELGFDFQTHSIFTIYISTENDFAPSYMLKHIPGGFILTAAHDQDTRQEIVMHKEAMKQGDLYKALDQLYFGISAVGGDYGSLILFNRFAHKIRVDIGYDSNDLPVSPIFK